MDPIIHERDAYMAAALAAAACGAPGGRTPAYVLTRGVDGRVVAQYAQPEGGMEGACPRGTGAGAFEPPSEPPQAVVAIVGTAPVRGMVRAWPAAQATPSLAAYL